MAGHFVHPWPPGRAWLGRGSPAEPPTAFPGARDPRRAERLARGDAGHPLLPSLHQRPLLDTRLVPGTIAGPEDTEAQWACPRPCFPLTLGGWSLRGVDPQRLLGTPSGRVRGHREDGTSRSRPMHAAPPGHSTAPDPCDPLRDQAAHSACPPLTRPTDSGVHGFLAAKGTLLNPVQRHFPQDGPDWRAGGCWDHPAAEGRLGRAGRAPGGGVPSRTF